ncbi:hypothetical protein NDU88_000923 [Pleurodeles waltl]|uniref:Uncharacterized protein n=1 Tax=Pleurodeles waltl TaxID=8319 RepID=A0AAV7S997_PLEWA|nr:hypothetical protein NDU88_000923 [Pleurodeles waltl]
MGSTRVQEESFPPWARAFRSEQSRHPDGRSHAESGETNKMDISQGRARGPCVVSGQEKTAKCLIQHTHRS